MRLTIVRFMFALAVVICLGNVSFGQCPTGLEHVDKQLYGEGSFGSNLVAFGEVLLPPGVNLDSSYHQASIPAVANGKSDARSRLVASEVPPGIYIVPSGDNSANHGWSVGDGPEPRIQLVPAVWDMHTNTISQYKFEMRLYCTTGSGEYDRTTGGCNVKVDVCFKRAPVSAKTVASKKKK